jgi:lipid-binding SYLF domain-containing protein
MRMTFPLAVVASIALFTSTGCSTAPKTEEGRQELQTESQQALDRFRNAVPGIADQLDRSYGYVIFPDAGKGGFIAGAAYGRGEVYEQGKMVGYADIRQGSIGAQIGGQKFSELIVFQTREALYKLKNNNFTFGADASAVLVEKGKSTATEFKDGVAVYTMPIKGAMVAAVVSGQKFTFVPREVGEAERRDPTTHSTQVKTSETTTIEKRTTTRP